MLYLLAFIVWALCVFVLQSLGVRWFWAALVAGIIAALAALGASHSGYPVIRVL